MKIIEDLIEDEYRRLAPPEHTGVQFTGFVTSWQAVTRYHTFLTLILEREAKATEAFSTASKALRDTPPSPGPYQTPEQRDRLNELDKATDVLHLEIESFYLFAKILLDAVARALEKYFGQGRACSLDSHHDLIDNFETYSKQKDLVVPTDFVEKAETLRKNISNFRDHDIAHDKRLNRVTGTALTHDGRATIIATSTVVPPEDFKPQATSIHVGELISSLDKYILIAIQIVKTNRDKRKLDYTI